MALLRGLETGELAEDEFERRFGDAARARRGTTDLITACSPGCGPSERWSTRCAPRGAAGVRPGLISNSWGTSHYDRVCSRSSSTRP